MSSAWTIGGGIGASGQVILGANNAILNGTNAAMNGLVCTGLGYIENVAFTNTAASAGIGITCAGASNKRTTISRCSISGYAGGAASNTTGLGQYIHIFNCILDAGAGTALVGPFLVENSSFAASLAGSTTQFVPGSQAVTTDVANGATVTPAPVAGVNYLRLRGTAAAGTATIAFPTSPVLFKTGQIQMLVLDMFANGGGTFTFNLNAGFHGPLATTGAIANGSRMVWTYSYNATENIWVAQSQTAAFA